MQVDFRCATIASTICKLLLVVDRVPKSVTVKRKLFLQKKKGHEAETLWRAFSFELKGSYTSYEADSSDVKK